MDGSKADGRTDQMRRCYNVADFSFSVVLSDQRDPADYLPSYASFESRDCLLGDRLFELVEDDLLSDDAHLDFLAEDRNDMGHIMLYRIPCGYRVELSYEGGDVSYIMEADESFGSIRARVKWTDRYAGVALTSMLRIAFAQAILPHNAVSVHSSAVVCDGKAVLFMGKSGTGKSTHSALWIKHIPGTELLNDDNPIVRVVDGAVMVYGSPWSGKTPCYKNASAPVAAMVKLKQGLHNCFEHKSDVAAFVALLPGCSVLRSSTALNEALYETLGLVTETVCVGELECLPDEEAAVLCRREVLRDMD